MLADLLERFDVLAVPAAQVVPFPVDQEYPTEIAGVTIPHNLGWTRVCSRITVSAHPVAAVPAGFTGTGCRWDSSSSAPTARTAGCSSTTPPGNPPSG